MRRLVLDKSMRSKFESSQGQLELCDESGKTLGYFLPTAQDEAALYRWAQGQISAAELERRKNEDGGRSTAEVLQRLGDA